MGAAKYTLTDEHRAELAPWAAKWIDIALRTEPQTETDREAMRVAMRGLYLAANLEPPPREVFCPSPISAAIAATIASCVWWLREQPERHAELFGRALTCAEIDASARHAVTLAVSAALGSPIPRTDDATRDATDDATDDAVNAATYAATYDAVVAAVADATYDAVAAAVDAATHAATRDAVNAAVDDATSPAVPFMLVALHRWGNLRNGGNQWPGACAYLSFFRHVAKLDLPQYEKWQHYEAAAIHGGPRFMHARFWIVSDFPTTIGRDAQNRSHGDTGPALAWRDGWKVYRVHGVTVPGDIIEHPETITVAQIDAVENAEVRRVMVERYGTARFLRDGGAEEISRDRFGVLWRRELSGDEPICMVQVQNSTPEPDLSVKTYWLRVPPTMKTPQAGLAWTFGLKPSEYVPAVET